MIPKSVIAENAQEESLPALDPKHEEAHSAAVEAVLKATAKAASVSSASNVLALAQAYQALTSGGSR